MTDLQFLIELVEALPEVRQVFSLGPWFGWIPNWLGLCSAGPILAVINQAILFKLD